MSNFSSLERAQLATLALRLSLSSEQSAVCKFIVASGALWLLFAQNISLSSVDKLLVDPMP